MMAPHAGLLLNQLDGHTHAVAPIPNGGKVQARYKIDNGIMDS